MDEHYLKEWTWDERQAWIALVESHHYLLARLDADLIERTGTKLATYEVLLHLGNRPDRTATITDLARACGLTTTGMAKRIGQLDREGLVTRASSSTDRRAVSVTLTDVGVARLEELVPVHLRAVRTHFLDVLEPAELDALGSVLARIVDALPPEVRGVEGTAEVEPYSPASPVRGRGTRLSDAERRAWLPFLRVHGPLQYTLEDELRTETGVPAAHYEVLALLSREPGWQMRMNVLAERCGLTRSGITRRMDMLEDEGLAERKAVPGDRRGTLAVMTPVGYAVLDKAAPSHMASVRRHFLDLVDEHELLVLFKALNRVVQSIRSEMP